MYLMETGDFYRFTGTTHRKIHCPSPPQIDTMIQTAQVPACRESLAITVLNKDDRICIFAKGCYIIPWITENIGKGKI
jgi:hypothetical protein